MPGDEGVLGTINELVAQEHALRSKIASGGGHTPEESKALKAVETQLDQCWDLLRQRRAKREMHESPSEAEVRPVKEVEGYLQ